MAFVSHVSGAVHPVPPLPPSKSHFLRFFPPPPASYVPRPPPSAPTYLRPSRQHLIFGYNFNQPVVDMKEWPHSLLLLSFGHAFDQTVRGLGLPPRLEVRRQKQCRCRCRGGSMPSC